MNVLIVYASRNNSTRETAEFIGDKLREHGYTVDVKPPDQIDTLEKYNAVIMGSGIYKGGWLPEMFSFMNRTWDELLTKPVFCWALCIRVLEEKGYEHAMVNYMPTRILNQMDLRDCRVFAGRLLVSEIDWDERWTLVLHYDGHMYPNNIDKDFRDWDAIAAWTTQITQQLDAAPERKY